MALNRMHIDGSTPLWIAARTLLAQRVEDFFRHRDRALKTSDPEEIHDLRVASRRLREGLALFASCYPGVRVAPLGRRLKRVTRLLGEIRNTDEAIIFFTALAEEIDAEHGKEMERILASFREKRGKELKMLESGLHDLAPDSLRRLFRQVTSAPSLFSPEEGGDLFVPLAQFAGEALKARLAAVLKLLYEATHPDASEAQHLLRIAVKHFRYRLEILSFLIGPRYDDIHETLKAYQDVLGTVHDLDVFAGTVREANLSPRTEPVILGAIAAKRRRFFADFSAMLETRPFAEIGEYLGSIL
ncbi:MAG TPA: CHAD domain-containing protein [Geobacteraceae bacterium]